MPLEAEDGEKVLQLISSRYDHRDWRKKIEKTLSLPGTGLTDEVQRKIFLYLKVELQAYKSRRADAHAWIVGGYATKEVIDRARHRPKDIDPDMTEEQVKMLGVDPGEEVDPGWWEDMLAQWFEEPEEEMEEEAEGEDEIVDEVSEDSKEPALKKSEEKN